MPMPIPIPISMPHASYPMPLLFAAIKFYRPTDAYKFGACHNALLRIFMFSVGWRQKERVVVVYVIYLTRRPTGQISNLHLNLKLNLNLNLPAWAWAGAWAREFGRV